MTTPKTLLITMSMEKLPLRSTLVNGVLAMTPLRNLNRDIVSLSSMYRYKKLREKDTKKNPRLRLDHVMKKKTVAHVIAPGDARHPYGPILVEKRPVLVDAHRIVALREQIKNMLTCLNLKLLANEKNHTVPTRSKSLPQKLIAPIRQKDILTQPLRISVGRRTRRLIWA